MKADFAISDGGQFAAQEVWRGAVLGGRTDRVDDANTGIGLECGGEVVEQSIGLCDLVIHVHQDRRVERTGRQPRIVRLTAGDDDILQAEIANALAQLAQIVRHDVFGIDASVGPDDRRKPHRVIAAACADVGDGHPAPDPEQLDNLLNFAGRITLLFVVPDRADDIRDRTFRLGKAIGGGARRAGKILSRCVRDEREREGRHNRNPQVRHDESLVAKTAGQRVP